MGSDLKVFLLNTLIVNPPILSLILNLLEIIAILLDLGLRSPLPLRYC